MVTIKMNYSYHSVHFFEIDFGDTRSILKPIGAYRYGIVFGLKMKIEENIVYVEYELYCFVLKYRVFVIFFDFSDSYLLLLQ